MDLVTIKQACIELQVKPRAIYRYFERGWLTKVKIGKLTRIKRGELDALKRGEKNEWKDDNTFHAGSRK